MSKQDWRKTLYLPQTNFPMKASLNKKEPEIINQWEKLGIYQKMMKRREGAESFFLSDGPIYANGPIHIGHTLNKILKDLTIKYKNMKGFKAPFIPSWDCHGLPIELKALGKKSLSFEEAGGEEFLRKICEKEALFWIKDQEKSFKRLGVLADWPNPVLTMDPSYIAEELEILAQLAEKGLIYRGTKPVFWCFRLKTALAFSEAEYKEDHKSPSIYVKFYLTAESQKKLKSKKPLFAPIWTTTPWTLPANSAVCLHPDSNYGVYEGEKESFLLAQSQEESFFKKAGLRPFPVLKKSFKGSELEGLKSLHPFIDRTSPLVLGDHVSLSTGTGLVHTAPGHGLEDYAVGKKYHLKEFCPIDERGCFTEEAPSFLRGLFIFKANELILNQLEKSGHLLAKEEIQHSYPYNPRSNSPLIYRLTPQWFLSLDKAFGGGGSLRQRALSACEKNIHFIPSFAKSRLSSMLESGPDWCLSRQRLWGVPLPAFYCKNCENPILEPFAVRASAQQIKDHGREKYFALSAKKLLPEGFKCSACNGAEFKKGEDILDVWFDSGVQHAVFAKKNPPGIFPSDVFLEGSDQHRGWFQTSLISALGWKEASPFSSLLTHGFVNDSLGHKMSKSRGNVLRPDKLIQQGGAEILRLWTAGENYTQDIRAGQESFQRVKESYRRFRNTFRFLLGNLNGFEPKRDLLTFKNLNAVDKWILGRLNLLIKEGGEAYDSFAFYKLYQQLNRFFSNDLSSFYLDIIKDRLYTFSKHSPERQKAQTALYHLTDKLLPFMAPISSFLCEEAYSYFQKSDKKESVFLEPFPSVVSEWKTEEWDQLFLKMFPLRAELLQELENLRRKGEIRSSLQARAIIYLEKDFIQASLSEQEIEEFFSVSKVEIKEGLKPKASAFRIEGEKCPRCWFFSSSLNKKGICPKCEKNLE